MILAGVALLPQFVDVVNRIFGTWDRTTVNAVILTTLVIISLFIVNTRAAYYFVLALVSPRELVPAARGRAPARGRATGRRARVHRAGRAPGGDGRADVHRANAADASGDAGIRRRRAEAPHSPAPAPAPAPVAAVPSGAPARIGATIGALERLLIVAFMLTGAVAAVGFVIAAKTIARFKQLDDRGFAEYYLLGTLASVAVAVASALVGQAALASLT